MGEGTKLAFVQAETDKKKISLHLYKLKQTKKN
jgi:hypothetical protein